MDDLQEEYKNIELRSEEVQEILGTPPSWLTRWGTLVAMITVLVLGWLGFWIKYPDVVEASIKVTTVVPPAKLVARETAFLTDLLVEDRDTVEEGQVLAVFSPLADYSDVLALGDQLLMVQANSDSSLANFRPYNDLLLGGLQQYLDDFRAAQETYQMVGSGQLDRLNTREKRRRISLLESQIENFQEAVQVIENQIRLSDRRFQNDKKRYESGAISLDELRQQQNAILALKREKATAESSIKSRQYEIDLLASQLNALRRDSQVGRETAVAELRASFSRLKKQLEEWKKNYLLISPLRGVVTFIRPNLREQGFVQRGEDLMMVLPVGIQDVVGRIPLKLKGSGKVKEGQEVIVKFDSYPFHEFGAVRGVVVKKGLVPIEDAIPVDVAFPSGLTTTKGSVIEVAQEMTGTAEIITDDRRLIERIFLGFRRVAS